MKLRMICGPVTKANRRIARWRGRLDKLSSLNLYGWYLTYNLSANLPSVPSTSSFEYSTLFLISGIVSSSELLPRLSISRSLAYPKTIYYSSRASRGSSAIHNKASCNLLGEHRYLVVLLLWFRTISSASVFGRMYKAGCSASSRRSYTVLNSIDWGLLVLQLVRTRFLCRDSTLHL